MRKLTFFSVLIFVVVICLTSFPNKTTAQSEIYKTYYCLNNQVDSSILEKDSIVFYKTQKSKKAAWLEFYENSEFCLFYNRTIDTITNVDKETGLYTQQTIVNWDKIEGKYAMVVNAISGEDSKDTYLKLTLEDKEIIEYDIIDQNDLLTLIKR